MEQDEERRKWLIGGWVVFLSSIPTPSSEFTRNIHLCQLFPWNTSHKSLWIIECCIGSTFWWQHMSIIQPNEAQSIEISIWKCCQEFRLVKQNRLNGMRQKVRICIKVDECCFNRLIFVSFTIWERLEVLGSKWSRLFAGLLILVLKLNLNLITCLHLVLGEDKVLQVKTKVTEVDEFDHIYYCTKLVLPCQFYLQNLLAWDEASLEQNGLLRSVMTWAD